MTRYVFRRLLSLIPMWIAVGFLTFLIMYMVPGDPLLSILGPDASPEARARMMQQLRLNEPFWRQFAFWIGDAARGDLGDSIFLDRPVAQALWERAPVTITLGIGALFFALLIGLPLGILAAIKANSRADTLVMIVSLIGLSTPEFLLGLMLISIFGVQLGVLPIGGYVPLLQSPVEGLRHLVMPAFTLGFIHAALVARMTRANMLEILRYDCIRTARAKGLSERVVLLKHTLRLAIIPVVTITGFAATLVVAGAFITEIVFTLPGMGNLVISAVLRRDYPLVQGAMLVIASGVLLLNLLVDILYVYLDPRVRYA